MCRKSSRWLLIFCAFGLFFVVFFSAVLFNGKYLTSGDGQVIALPAYLGAHGWWEPNIMLGYPWASNLNAYYYPLWLLHLIPDSFNAYMLLAYTFAAFGTFGLVFRVTRSTMGGVVAGLGYSLGGFMIGHLGHYDVVHPAAWAPFVLWSVAELRRKVSAAWIVVAALSVGLCATAGQPQVLAYTLFVAIAYIATTAFRHPAARSYVIACASAIVLGIGACAVALLPAAELAHASVRARLPFADFVSFAIVPAEIPIRLLFPWFLGATTSGIYPFSAINPADFTEVSNYVGIATLIFGCIALLASNADIEVRFWIVVACAGLVLSTGDKLGIARFTYHVPIYNLFRAQGRNALEVTLAFAVLAGFGVAAIDRRRAMRRHVVGAVALVGGLLVISLVVIAVAGRGFARTIEATTVYKIFPIDPLHNPALGIPLLVFTIAAVAIVAWSARPDSRYLRAAVLVAVILDMSSFAWFSYWRWGAVDRATLKPPAYAAELRGELVQNHERMLSLTPLSALQPNLPLLWDLPDAGGYVQLLLARPGEFLQMYPNGEVRLDLLAPDDQALDLAAVRYVAASPSPATVPIGAPWYGGDLRLRIGTQPWGVRSDVSVAFPEPIESTAIALQAVFEGVTPSDTSQLARLDAHTADGRTLSFALTAVLAGSVHFTKPERISALAIHWLGAPSSSAALDVSYLSLLDEPHALSYPVTTATFLTSGPTRWRPVAGTAPDLIFENRHAVARAWLVHDVRAATEDEKNVRTHDVDLRTVAFAEGAKSWKSPTPPANAESANVREYAPERMLVDVRCAARCFLVTSDADYEGWHASIDGAPVRVYRTDYALRGVDVPSGRHNVQFTYLPWTIPVGAAVSLLSLLILAGIALSTKVVQGAQGAPGNRPEP